MPLAPPREGESHASLEELIRSVNQHAGPEGYAVVMARTKVSKLGVKRKAWLRCDRGGKSSGPKGQIRIHAASRRINCPFSLIAKLQDARWSFRIVDGAHSHDPTPPETHPVLRRMALAEKKNNGGVVGSSAGNGNMNMNMNMDVDVDVQMIQSAEVGEEGEGDGEDGISGSGILLDAGDKSTTLSGNYLPHQHHHHHHHQQGVEAIPQESRRPKPAQMRSIEADLLGRLNEALDPRIQNGGGVDVGVLLPNHVVGVGGPGPENQSEDSQSKELLLDRGNTDPVVNMDKNLEMMNLDISHYRKAAATATAAAAAAVGRKPPVTSIPQQLSPARRKVVQRRNPTRNTVMQPMPSPSQQQQQQQQQQQVTDPILSTRSFGINSS